MTLRHVNRIRQTSGTQVVRELENAETGELPRAEAEIEACGYKPAGAATAPLAMRREIGIGGSRASRPNGHLC